MERGIVTKWNTERGFGYLRSEDGRYWWFHASVIVSEAPMKQRNLMIGQAVEFEPGTTRRGPIAFSVHPLRPEEYYGELVLAEVSSPAAGQVSVVGI